VRVSGAHRVVELARALRVQVRVHVDAVTPASEVREWSSVEWSARASLKGERGSIAHASGRTVERVLPGDYDDVISASMLQQSKCT
jgi:hypothetical protein